MPIPRETLRSLEPVPGGAAGTFRARASFPASWPVLAGHFPGRAIVPAWALLGLVREVAERALGRPAELASIERTKLARPVGPDEEVVCLVELSPEGELVRARAQLSSASGPVGTISCSLRVGS